MFDHETTVFLEGGSALIVATVTPDGAPHAGRAWGLDVLPGEPAQVRVLLDVDDTRTIEHAAAGGAIAVTATDVRSLRSVQLKGRTRCLEEAASDAARAERYIEQFFGDIQDTDGTARALLDNFVPAGYVGCTVEVIDRFDQTPGPGAGAALGASRA